MQLQEFLDRLFQGAQRRGIAACEAYIRTGDSFSAQVVNGEVVDFSASSGLGLSFRALVDGKMGYASTQALDEDAVGMLIEGVVTNARLIGSADEQFIFPGSASYPRCDVYNPAIDAIPAVDKIGWAKALEKHTLAQDPRIAQVEACVILTESQRVRIVNSMGLDVSHGDNVLGAYSAPVAKDGDRVNSGFEYQFVRSPEALDIGWIAKAAAAVAVDQLDGQSVPSGKYRVVVENTAMASLLGAFDGVFSADEAQKGLSLLKGKEGQVIASSAVTLMDDPLDARGACCAPFDAEGVAAYPKKIIDGGTLTTLLHNLKTAKKQGLSASTGNASKAGYAAPVTVAPSNFFFAPGADALDALLLKAGDGLLITELQGLHAGTNAISGDFSLAAKGYVIEGGRKGRAVAQITLSGNFFELLKGILAVGDDLRFSMPGASCIGSPSVLVKELSVAGE